MWYQKTGVLLSSSLDFFICKIKTRINLPYCIYQSFKVLWKNEEWTWSCFVNPKLRKVPTIWASSSRYHFPFPLHPIIYHFLSIFPLFCKVRIPSLHPFTIWGLIQGPIIWLDELTCLELRNWKKKKVSFLFFLRKIHLYLSPRFPAFQCHARLSCAMKTGCFLGLDSPPLFGCRAK